MRGGFETILSYSFNHFCNISLIGFENMCIRLERTTQKFSLFSKKKSEFIPLTGKAHIILLSI